MTHARVESHPASRRHEQVHPHRVKFRWEARLQLEALHLEPRTLEERERFDTIASLAVKLGHVGERLFKLGIELHLGLGCEV